MERNRTYQPGLPGIEDDEVATAVARAFDPSRLTQARLLADKTKTVLAKDVGLSSAAIGQFESGTTRPRPEHLPKLADKLNVPIRFFAAGRPYARVDAGVAHFRRLRSTRVGERAKALAYVEQVWELVHALELHIEFPFLDLPELPNTASANPAAAAREVRRYWEIAPGPLPHLVRTLEIHDAFSTSRLPRPIVVLTPDRADDVYRHRFTAAHELGHILMHHEMASGEIQTEREANAFAAELLAPADEIAAALGSRPRIKELTDIGHRWGISVKSLVKRSSELGLMSDVTARRSYQQLNQLADAGLLPSQPITSYPGETPCLLGQAYDLAEENGLTVAALAAELAWPLPRVRELLGRNQERPTLRLVKPGES
jgi:transcriptional regulator with XRE-family HTH domain